MHIYPRLSKARVRSRRAAETFERLASCGVHEIRAILYRDRCLHSTSVRDYSQLILHFRGRRGGDQRHQVVVRANFVVLDGSDATMKCNDVFLRTPGCGFGSS